MERYEIKQQIARLLIRCNHEHNVGYELGKFIAEELEDDHLRFVAVEDTVYDYLKLLFSYRGHIDTNVIYYICLNGIRKIIEKVGDGPVDGEQLAMALPEYIDIYRNENNHTFMVTINAIIFFYNDWQVLSLMKNSLELIAMKMYKKEVRIPTESWRNIEIIKSSDLTSKSPIELCIFKPTISSEEILNRFCDAFKEVVNEQIGDINPAFKKEWFYDRIIEEYNITSIILNRRSYKV